MRCEWRSKRRSAVRAQRIRHTEASWHGRKSGPFVDGRLFDKLRKYGLGAEQADSADDANADDDEPRDAEH